MVGDATHIEQLKRDRDRFVGFAFAAADALLEVDGDLRVRYAAGLGAIVGNAEQGVAGTPLASLIGTGDWPGVMDALRAAGDAGRVAAATVRLGPAGAELRDFVLSGWRLPDLGGHYFLALRKAAGAAATATRDAATGLLDGDAFAASVAGLAGRAGSDGAMPTMTLLELKGLAALGERLDPDQSEDLTGRIAALLKLSSLDGATAARTGQESFGFVHGAGVDAAAVSRALEDLVKTSDPDRRGIEVRDASVALDDSGLNSDEAAEAVLYAMRKFGEAKDRSVTLGSLSRCCKVMVADTMQRMQTLKSTIEGDAFRLVMQPIVEIRNGHIHHYEVLSRFPAEESRSPQHLIAFAEEVGAIHEFDLRVVKRSIELLEANPKRDLSLAVNLSMRSLDRPQFITALQDAFQGREELRKRLIFEITETARIDDLSAANRAVQVLRRAGHAVCLDDFGAGAAAFQYLKAFTVDVIKIDGAYVNQAIGSSRGRAFLKAMAGLCLELKVDVVGEMVEDAETARFLESCGVRYGQGYYFGRPEPPGTTPPRVRGTASPPPRARPRASIILGRD